MKSRNLPIRITLREWRFVALVIIILLLLTSLPYIFAAITAPSDKHFMGFILNASDHAQYLAWYKGFQSSFLIPNILTPESNPPSFINLLWFTLSRVGLVLRLNYIIVYQLFRWFAGAFFLGVAYIFGALIFPQVNRRRTFFLIVSLGSGLGWIWVFIKYVFGTGELLFPLDVYIAEGNTFLCVMAYPHFLAAASLILVVFCLLILGERSNNIRFAFFAGLVAHILGWQHGYDLLIVWCIPFFYIVIKWLRERHYPRYWVRALVITGFLSSPPAIYSLLLTNLNPIWKEVLSQFSNAGVFSPNLAHMIVLMGLTLILALIITILIVFSTKGKKIQADLQNNNYTFILVWFIVGWGLAYIPADFQIHMLNSWQVPIGILATIGLYDFIKPSVTRWIEVHRSQLIVVMFIGLILPTNIYLWMWRFIDLSRYDYPYYLYTDEIEAMEWLRSSSPSDAIVVSSYDIGRYIPGITGRRAYLAHWAATVDYYNKRETVDRFYDAQVNDTERIMLMNTYNIEYFIWGPAEREIGLYNPSDSPLFDPVFTNTQVTIYQMKQD